MLSPLETATLFVNHDPSRDGGKVLRGVLKPDATIDQILADVRRMDVCIEETHRRDMGRVRSVEAVPGSNGAAA